MNRKATRAFSIIALGGVLSVGLASCGGTHTSSLPLEVATKDAGKKQVWIATSIGITGEGTTSATLKSEAERLLNEARTEFANRTAAGMSSKIDGGNIETEARATLESILEQKTQNRRDLSFEIYSLSATDMIKTCNANLNLWLEQNPAYGLSPGDKTCASDSNGDGRATVNIPNRELSEEYGFNYFHKLSVDMKTSEGTPYFNEAHETAMNAEIQKILVQRAAANQPHYIQGAQSAPVVPAQ